MDPFLDLIRLLRPKTTLWGGVDGVGRWSIAFRKREDLLFCWIEQGECQLMRPFADPIHLQPQDFILVRTTTPFVLTSDPTMTPQDSEALVAATKNARLQLGEGNDAPVTLSGGRFVFDTANEELLTSLLPAMVHVTARDASSLRVQTLLKMNRTEFLHPRPGSEFITTRLMELILVETLRSEVVLETQGHQGLLAGLADLFTARALSAIHNDPAHEWTVAELANLCNVSRSNFAARFRKIMGKGPLEYLQQWRIALAKDELRYGTQSIGAIAFLVGFQSSSAFSTAFTRAVGCSPTQFVASVQTKN